MQRALPWIVAVGLGMSHPARADGPSTGDGVVVLKDGTILHGEIVEVVTGDHVVVRIGGESKQLPWAAVSTVVAGAPPQAPATNMWATLRGNALSLANSDGPVVDWPEPDRSPPSIMPSRLSVGLEAGVGGVPVGTFALAAELYPWQWSIFQVGFHGAYGPNGFVGPTVSEMITADIAYGPVEEGLGVGLAHSFRSASHAMPGAPDRVDVLDLDVSHFSVFITREVMLRAMLGLELPVSSGCDDTGKVCGNTSVVYGLATLMWNFDLSRGDQ